MWAKRCFCALSLTFLLPTLARADLELTESENDCEHFSATWKWKPEKTEAKEVNIGQWKVKLNVLSWDAYLAVGFNAQHKCHPHDGDNQSHEFGLQPITFQKNDYNKGKRHELPLVNTVGWIGHDSVGHTDFYTLRVDRYDQVGNGTVVDTYIKITGRHDQGIANGTSQGFTTPPGGGSSCNFGAMPVSGGFFGSGSDPFLGTVAVKGSPLSSSPPGSLGGTDMIVQRFGPGLLPDPGGNVSVPIEIVALSLVSVNPITVTYNGGLNPQLWDVRVGLSNVQPQPMGNMTIRRANSVGGTYDSVLPILPKFTFVRRSDGFVRQLDFGAPPQRPAIMLQTTNVPWLKINPDLDLQTWPSGVLVDHDSDTATPQVPVPPTNLADLLLPIWAEDRASQGIDGMMVPGLGSRLIRQQGSMASLNVLIARHDAVGCLQSAAGDQDNDGVCDVDDNCWSHSNPGQSDTDKDGAGDFCDNCANLANPSQSDTDRDGAGDACDAPLVTMVASRKTHLDTHQDIYLPPVGSFPATESRPGGPTSLRFTFTRPVHPADGILDNELVLSNGFFDSLALNGGVLEAQVNGIPDRTCLTMTLAGLVDSNGLALEVPAAMRLRVLYGDARGDGTVNLGDALLIRSRIGMEAGPGSAGWDLNLSGMIDPDDMLIAKSRIGAHAVCP